MLTKDTDYTALLPRPKFFLLKVNEVIMPGDEYYNSENDNWEEVSHEHIMEPYKGPSEYGDHILVLRRKNPDFFYDHQRWL